MAVQSCVTEELRESDGEVNINSNRLHTRTGQTPFLYTANSISRDQSAALETAVSLAAGWQTDHCLPHPR